MNTNEIKARADKATPGPWVWWDGCSWRRLGSEATGKTVVEPTTYSREDRHPDCLIRNEHDKPFIAHAREDIPWLLERVRQLEELVKTTADTIQNEGMDGWADQLRAKLEALSALPENLGGNVSS